MTTSLPVSASARKRRWPWLLLGVLLLGGAGSGLWLRHRKTQQTSISTQTTSTATAQRGVLRVSVSGPGTLEAHATRTVGADLTATVGTVPAVGERVQKGQLITILSSDTVQDNVRTALLNLKKAQVALEGARVSQASNLAQRQSSLTSAQNNFRQAQQALDQAQQNVVSQQKLWAVGAVSVMVLKDARSALTKAQDNLTSSRSSLQAAQTQQQTGQQTDAQNIRNQQLAVAQAQEGLITAQRTAAKLKVYAPISGVISTVTASEGAVVNSGATILTLLDDTTLNLPVQIDETQIAGVQTGQRSEVSLDAFEGQIFSGKVVRVSPGATQSNGISVFTATVELKNTEHQLRSGMTAEAEIIQREARGLLIPVQAVQTVRTRSYVDLPGPPGAAPQRVRIHTGASDSSDIIVTEGLQEGQQVLIPGKKAASSGRSGSGRSGSGRSGSGRSGSGRSGSGRSGSGRSGSSDRQSSGQGGFNGPPPGGLP